MKKMHSTGSKEADQYIYDRYMARPKVNIILIAEELFQRGYTKTRIHTAKVSDVAVKGMGAPPRSVHQPKQIIIGAQGQQTFDDFDTYEDKKRAKITSQLKELMKAQLSDELKNRIVLQLVNEL